VAGQFCWAASAKVSGLPKNRSERPRLCENSGSIALSLHSYRRSVEKPVQLDERTTITGVFDRFQSTGRVFTQPRSLAVIHLSYIHCSGVLWGDARSYRVAVTIGNEHNSADGLNNLFKDMTTTWMVMLTADVSKHFI